MMLLLLLLVPTFIECLFIPRQGPTLDSSFRCHFNDSRLTEMVEKEDHKGSRSVRSAQDPAPIYNWSREKGRVPYSFSRSVSRKDRALVRSAMDTIEAHTCFRFIDRGSSAPVHSFRFSTGRSRFGTPISCRRQNRRTGAVSYPFGGYVADYGQTVVFRSSYDVADHPDCHEQNEPKLLHELMHILGAIHTHQRGDRDDHIQVHRDNISHYSQYQKCTNCDDHGVPYDCDSIMHYGYLSGSNGKGPTMTSKSAKCVISKDGGPKQPTDNDWKLLNKMGQEQC